MVSLSVLRGKHQSEDNPSKTCQRNLDKISNPQWPKIHGPPGKPTNARGDIRTVGSIFDGFHVGKYTSPMDPIGIGIGFAFFQKAIVLGSCFFSSTIPWDHSLNVLGLPGNMYSSKRGSPVLGQITPQRCGIVRDLSTCENSSGTYQHPYHPCMVYLPT